MTRATILLFLLLVGCDSKPTAPSADAVAVAAAEHKAVADVDGARRDATAVAQSAIGTEQSAQ